MQSVPGGVTAAAGFRAAGIHAGLRKNKTKPDLALIVADRPCPAAAVYTRNVVKADPLLVTQEHLGNGMAQAVIANSGNANACAPEGRANAEQTCRKTAEALGIPVESVVVASTGVIGQRLPVEKILKAIPDLCKELSDEGSANAARAIMTTDTVSKEAAVRVEIGGKTVTVGGMAKGSGMVAPNMGTLLAFLTTDCAVSPEFLQKSLAEAVEKTFNRVVIDGDTSTNDMAVIMASGLAGNAEITVEGEAVFSQALRAVCLTLTKMIAADAEGATKLIAVDVKGAADEQSAACLAKSVAGSSLVKAAMFGRDANIGRVLCALGYCGLPFDVGKVQIAYASGRKRLQVCQNGLGLAFDEDLALEILSEKEITIDIDMGAGPGQAQAFGCDLTYDYVKINGEYRT